MNTIFLSFDSLNRSYLGPYRDPEGPYAHVDTGNFDRLATRTCTFDKHWITSTPCMPARRDIWTGRAEFPWRNWGPLDGCDQSLFNQLHDTDVWTQLFCDHQHMWERGASNYHVDFKGVEFVRGQETDNWKSDPVEPTAYDSGMLAERSDPKAYGSGAQYLSNRGGERKESDYPGPTNMRAATEWLRKNSTRKQPFCLVIDEFDPHEPFDCPEPYRSMYLENKDDLEKGYTYWPTYGPSDRYSKDEVAYIRAQYCGVLTMMDRALGRFLDAMDENDLWQDTLLIVTTDHGHYLGEYDFLGKNTKSLYPFYANTPLFIHCPESPLNGQRSDALNNMVDVSATLFDAHGLTPAQPIHGRSLLPILKGESERIRDGLLYGSFGKALYYTDGDHLLCQASQDGFPLNRYGLSFESLVNRGEDPYSDAEAGRFLPWTQSPVLKAPGISTGAEHEPSFLIDLQTDWAAENNLYDQQPDTVARLQQKMISEMQALQMPEEHYARLGLQRTPARK